MILKTCERADCQKAFTSKLTRRRFCSRLCSNRALSDATPREVRLARGKRGGATTSAKRWKATLEPFPEPLHPLVKALHDRSWQAGYMAAKRFYEQQQEAQQWTS